MKLGGGLPCEARMSFFSDLFGASPPHKAAAKRAAAVTLAGATGLEQYVPGRGGVVELPAAIGTLPEAASQGSAVRAEGKVVGLSAVRAVGLSGIEEAPPPSAAAQAAAAYAIRAKEASSAHAANIARNMDPTVASLLWEQALLAAREALHYSPPTDPDNSMLEAGIAALQDAISNAQTGRVADHDPRDSGADASRCPTCGQPRRH